MGNYQGYGLEGASPVDLVVALYDGIIRFLYLACDAVERRDTDARRGASKRAMDIIIHLQSRLRMDVGGKPAEALSEFYAATYAEIILASRDASTQKFQHAIDCVRNVREAWRQVALDPSVNSAPPQPVAMDEGSFSGATEGSHWNA